MALKWLYNELGTDLNLWLRGWDHCVELMPFELRFKGQVPLTGAPDQTTRPVSQGPETLTYLTPMVRSNDYLREQACGLLRYSLTSDRLELLELKPSRLKLSRKLLSPERVLKRSESAGDKFSAIFFCRLSNRALKARIWGRERLWCWAARMTGLDSKTAWLDLLWIEFGLRSPTAVLRGDTTYPRPQT